MKTRLVRVEKIQKEDSIHNFHGFGNLARNKLTFQKWDVNQICERKKSKKRECTLISRMLVIWPEINKPNWQGCIFYHARKYRKTVYLAPCLENVDIAVYRLKLHNIYVTSEALMSKKSKVSSFGQHFLVRLFSRSPTSSLEGQERPLHKATFIIQCPLRLQMTKIGQKIWISRLEAPN